MRFNILGPLEISGFTVSCPPTAPMPRRVLALLLVNANRVVPIEKFVFDLWGDDPPPTAVTTVQTYIYQLRKVLESGQRRNHRLITRPPGYQLRVEPDELDLWEFERLVDDAEEALADGDAQVAADMLREAVGLWRGGALADIGSGTLLLAEKARLEESRLHALEQRVEADLRLGRHRPLISELKRLIVDHPLHEGFHAQLMLALYRAGRTHEALAVYQRLRAELVEELGLEPGPDLQRLQHDVLAGSRSLDLAPAARTPARTGSPFAMAPPAELPPDIADFTGRGGELRMIADCLAAVPDRTAPPIVLLTGLPGAGKSALAVRAAHQARPSYPDGQLFATLRGPDRRQVEVADVLTDFLRELGFPPGQLPADAGTLSRLFRSWSADRKLLVVLDDAQSSAQIRPLLPGGAGCAVLVNCRRVILGIGGIRMLELGPLGVSDGVDLLARLLGPARVEQDRAAAEALVRLCGGLPLALRAVATRLAGRRAQPLSSFARRLAAEPRRLDELRVGEDLDVRAALDQAQELVSDRASRALRLLGVFGRSSFTAGAAGSVLGGEIGMTERILDELVDAHLVLLSEAERDGDLTYCLPELVRIWAQEKLETEQVSGATNGAALLNPPFRSHLARPAAG